TRRRDRLRGTAVGGDDDQILAELDHPARLECDPAIVGRPARRLAGLTRRNGRQHARLRAVAGGCYELLNPVLQSEERDQPARSVEVAAAQRGGDRPGRSAERWYFPERALFV